MTSRIEHIYIDLGVKPTLTRRIIRALGNSRHSCEEPENLLERVGENSAKPRKTHALAESIQRAIA